MWRSVFALAVTATVIWEVSTTDCSVNDWPEDSSDSSDSSCSGSDSGSWEDNSYPNKCPKSNEVYDLCPVNCPFRTCGKDDRLVDCSPSQPRPGDPNCPKPACRCKDQTFRDDKGNCVPWGKCPKCTKPNEVYDPCDSPCPARRCDFNAAVVRCAAPPKIGDPLCLVGCRCKDGYLRDSNGVCIPAEKCPKCTKLNEVYDPCPDCSPQTCKTKDDKYNCPMIPVNKTGPNCYPACRCKPGYFRNLIGECIMASNCDKCPAEHEFFSCGSACDNVCATLCKQNKTNCPIKNKKCSERCYCEDGYARATNNTCILIQDCKDDCRVNEVYSSCPDASCAPLTCAQAGFPIKCAKYSRCPGKPGCICKSGYLRNDKGICIPAKECPSCGGDENAYSGCGSNCGKKCSEIGKNVTICALFCSINGCDCRDNYYYDANRQKCVQACDCTTLCSKANHEVYSNCTNGGVPRNCSQKGLPCPNINAANCERGCVCEDNYLRHDNGTCIPSEQCPIVCKENQVYSNCTNGGCDAKNCSQMGYRVPCVDNNSESCVAGCTCVNGYLMADNGTCIPRDQCPSCGGDPNAQGGCGNCGRSCSDYTNPRPMCPLRPCYITDCQCKPDYVYDYNLNKCVLPKDCTSTCKVNEIYSNCSNGLCKLQNCTQYGQPIPFCPKFDLNNCRGGCICQDGYLRNPAGICIPQTECPAKCSKLNEEYDPCPDCSPQTCKTKDDKYHCPMIPANKTGPNCKPACRCKPGFFRNLIGECILASNCDKCPAKHEFFSCGSACDDVCATLCKQNKTNCPIKNIKCTERCYCEDGYARATNNTCILVKDCKDELSPRQCNTNEVEECVKTCPPERTCRNKGIVFRCRDDPHPCQKKCVCAEGYYRNAIGECITGAECDKCRLPNEFYSCGSACDNECINIDTQNRTNCPILNIVCNKKCYCDDGYARDAAGNCIPVDQCNTLPPRQCSTNEVEECVKPCPPERTCRNKGIMFSCQEDPCPCQKKCVCAKGYYRNAIGECITGAECDNCTRPNEFYSCNSACDNECININTQNRTNCPIINIVCNKKCYCDDGYARDAAGNCIPVDQCRTPCSDPNEVYECGKSCPPDQCFSLVARIKCDSTEVSRLRCKCRPGYLRVKDGSPCIPICECPEMENSPDCK